MSSKATVAREAWGGIDFMVYMLSHECWLASIVLFRKWIINFQGRCKSVIR